MGSGGSGGHGGAMRAGAAASRGEAEASMKTAERPGPAPGTVLDRLVAGLRAKAAPLDGEARPAAVLWTDPREEWRPLVDVLLQSVEECVVLGDYAPARRTGPAVWLRCVVDGALDEPALPGDRPPIVYLPGVARQDLRAGGECPDGLKPLVELLFRGALWRQPNGGDWTVNAFLTSRKTLGLDVAGDRATAEALLRALPEVALAPVAQLEGRRLEADDFDRMLAGDVIRDLLRWMGDPETTRARLGGNGWHAFCNRCQDELGFNPAQEADVVAGERMAGGEGAWSAVWERFAEAPGGYGDIAGLLRRSAPAGTLRFEERERWPDLNDDDEGAVRDALGRLPALPHREACEAVAALEKQHGERRAWVWARLGLAPMAGVLKPLAALAAAARRALGGTEPADVAAPTWSAGGRPTSARGGRWRRPPSPTRRACRGRCGACWNRGWTSRRGRSRPRSNAVRCRGPGGNRRSRRGTTVASSSWTACATTSRCVSPSGWRAAGSARTSAAGGRRCRR